ncbi:MAG: NYN domain-containing protein [Sedimentisphaerales bacterium]
MNNSIKNNYLPKEADWNQLFDYFVSIAAPGGERVRTYWYVVQFLDMFPYKFPDIEKYPDALRSVLDKSKSVREELATLQDEALLEKMKEITEILVERENIMRHRFEWWRNFHDNISYHCSRIEFRQAGAITFNAFESRLQREKAVDVKLATDLITLRDIYDVGVIVSGDQDYVPAVQRVKDYGKTIINVVFVARNGKLLPGGARRLNHVTDESIKIKYDNLAGYLKIPTVKNVKPKK